MNGSHSQYRDKEKEPGLNGRARVLHAEGLRFKPFKAPLSSKSPSEGSSSTQDAREPLAARVDNTKPDGPMVNH